MTHEERYEAIVKEYNKWTKRYDAAEDTLDYDVMSLCAFMSNAIVAAVVKSNNQNLKTYFQHSVACYFH